MATFSSRKSSTSVRRARSSTSYRSASSDRRMRGFDDLAVEFESDLLERGLDVLDEFLEGLLNGLVVGVAGGLDVEVGHRLAGGGVELAAIEDELLEAGSGTSAPDRPGSGRAARGCSHFVASRSAGTKSDSVEQDSWRGLSNRGSGRAGMSAVIVEFESPVDRTAVRRRSADRSGMNGGLVEGRTQRSTSSSTIPGPNFARRIAGIRRLFGDRGRQQIGVQRRVAEREEGRAAAGEVDRGRSTIARHAIGVLEERRMEVEGRRRRGR